MARQRRLLSPFSLSFLDIMFCGFGAVVLLVLVINANTKRERYREQVDLRTTVERLALGVDAAEQLRAELELERQAADTASEDARARAEKLRAEIKRLRAQAQELQTVSSSGREDLVALQAELKQLAAKREQMEQAEQADTVHGAKARAFEGEGNRQYLTGLKLGGERVLILLDSSASMLERTIVNIIRRRNLSKTARKQSAKWQRSLRTVDWLLANLPPESKVQVIAFGEEPLVLSPEGWIGLTEGKAMAELISALRDLVPSGPTSLENVFTAAAGLRPRPDNIVLITDGLPTIGKKRGGSTKVTGKRRISLFEQARSKLPRGIPVNTILLPLEGDPMAAALYWKLGMETEGSFFTPTSDWP
jgi:hypothetical protein